MAESKPPGDEHQREQPERVEGKDPATDVSGVPAVQQEALQELARQIVREAGLQAGEQRELRETSAYEKRVGRFSQNLEVLRSTWNMQFEIAKHTSAGSGVFLLALGALVGVFSPDPSLPMFAGVALVLLVVSFLVSLWEMDRITHVILLDIARGTISVEGLAGLPEEMAAQQVEHIPEEALDEAFKEVLEDAMEKLPGPGWRRTMLLWSVARWTVRLALYGGVGCFLVFVLYNFFGGLWP